MSGIAEMMQSEHGGEERGRERERVEWGRSEAGWHKGQVSKRSAKNIHVSWRGEAWSGRVRKQSNAEPRPRGRNGGECNASKQSLGPDINDDATSPILKFNLGTEPPPNQQGPGQRRRQRRRAKPLATQRKRRKWLPSLNPQAQPAQERPPGRLSGSSNIPSREKDHDALDSSRGDEARA